MPSTGARSLEAKDPPRGAGHDRNVVVARLRRGTYKCCFLDENEKTVIKLSGVAAPIEPPRSAS